MKNIKNKLYFLLLFFVTVELYAQETFILNYEEVDIKKVTQDIAQFSKKTIILDPRVKGKISIYSNATLDRDQVWNVFLRTIQVNGFSAISDNGFVRIVPENEATRDLNFALDERADYVTEIIALKNRGTDEVLPMLKPITGRQSHLSSIPSINSLLIVDRSSNVERIKDLLKDLDRNNTAKISIIELSRLSATEAVRILDRLKAQNNPAINKFIAIPFTPSNSVIVSANDYITNNIKDTLKQLDDDVKTDSSIEVIYLKFAKAQEVASILSSVSSRFKNSNERDQTVITHHEKTNSLVISSDQNNINNIKNLISKLDIRRAQVLVEAIIVELSETAANTLGVESVFSGANSEEIPIGMTRLNSSGPDLVSIIGSASDEDNAALSSSAVASILNSKGLVAGIGDLTPGEDNFAAIVNAIQEDKNSNILSKPSILAMDNETAKSSDGQEIPVTTGESLGSNNQNPFRTTSRQEVGISLEVTPQINEGNSVLLDIKIEVSGVAGVVSSGVDLITNKRTIETTALVENNEIMVLGGLIDEDLQENVNKVPVLGSIPIFGKLFQSSSESAVKRNLMIFIKPSIMTDAESSELISSEKYNYIKAEQIISGKENLLEELE
ncbi:MAG: general secretion pathway protein D [SAR86 cluster bacterium SAR86B]|jgi:general secretion pathway protein D|uniref:General secretion pathway protein D n=1 Tax=SAR86 cluster bacterium SAR86B TaxID=1123867 RepID=J4KSE6_9GAMM|nr:MAG: general secretion pathway protein D [SAR86 cluster bacterium SAR86B]|tara:strand:- start:211 stop:2052 length:1842 start_codon:yes stop_codon:yes gene_type:complete